MRQSSGDLATEVTQSKAPEDWYTPRRFRAIRKFKATEAQAWLGVIYPGHEGWGEGERLSVSIIILLTISSNSEPSQEFCRIWRWRACIRMETAVNDTSTMKKILITLLAAAVSATGPLLGQPIRHVPTQNAQQENQNLTRFDMDFPGGTPEELVRAIERASGTSVNVVIPSEHTSVRLPPLKMKGVTVFQLFAAIERASNKTIWVPMANGTHQSYSAGYGFRTDEPPTDRAVWYFYYNPPSMPQIPSTCRFYQLAPYLETYKVEDITTAIQTGWKMLGETNSPTISFHKDTKLLIAVGEQSKLQLIDSVLQQLAQGKPQSQRGATGEKTAEPAKK